MCVCVCGVYAICVCVCVCVCVCGKGGGALFCACFAMRSGLYNRAMVVEKRSLQGADGSAH